MRAALPLVLFGAALVSGCAGHSIKETMPAYVGSPASMLIGKLGYPTAEQRVAGNKVYVWNSSRLVDGTTYACTIRAIIDSRENIVSWDFEGNEGGCYRFAAKLQ